MRSLILHPWLDKVSLLKTSSLTQQVITFLRSFWLSFSSNGLLYHSILPAIYLWLTSSPMTKYLLSFPKHLMHPTCGAFPLSVRVAFPWWTTSVNPSVRLLQLPADLYMVYYYLLLLWAPHSSGFLSYGLDGGWSPPQQDLYRCHYLLI